MRMWSLRGRAVKGALRLLGLGAALVLLALAAADLGSGSGSLAAEGCTITLSPGESIQQAIDDAPPGAVICLGEGTWEENLVIRKSVTLRGAGADKTVIRSAWESRPVVWIEGSEIEVILEGLTLTGGEQGLMAEDSAQVTLQDCQVSGNGWAGLSVGSSAQVTLQDSKVLENLLGLCVWDSARVTLQDSTVSGNRDDGLSVGSSARVSLQDSQVSGNGGDGLYVQDSAQVTLQDCQVSGNGEDGLHVGGSAQVELTDCWISDNFWCGIRSVNEAAVITGWGNWVNGYLCDYFTPPPGFLRDSPPRPLVDRAEVCPQGCQFSTIQEAIIMTRPGGDRPHP